LLHIDLAKPEPEVRVKTIPISRNGAGSGYCQNGVESGAMVESKPEPG